MARFTVPFEQLVQVRAWGNDHADWRCMVGGNTVAYDDRERAGCRYDHNADSYYDAVKAATEHIRAWHSCYPIDYADDARLELYGVSGHTDAIADGLEGEPRWMVNAAGRLLQDAGDKLAPNGDEPL